MTIYSVLVAILICTTIIVCVGLLVTHRIHICITTQDLTPKPTPKPAPTPDKKLEEELNSTKIPNLDGVIRAANELMGIDMEDLDEQTN